MNINSLFVNRGPIDGNMVTTGIHLEISSQNTYVLGNKGLHASNKTLYATNLEEVASNPRQIEIPAHLEIAAIWDETPYHSGSNNNIFSASSAQLIFSENILSIPAIEATDEKLGYYGATLIKQGDLVRFSNDNYPIFTMQVGQNYINEFIMTPEGGGYYLEYHTDKPHFHMSLNGGGYYLLAKWSDETKANLHITAFRINNGEAIYTRMGAIHCDAALSGDLVVGYDNSENASTAFWRTKKGEMVQAQFLPE